MQTMVLERRINPAYASKLSGNLQLEMDYLHRTGASCKLYLSDKSDTLPAATNAYIS